MGCMDDKGKKEENADPLQDALNAFYEAWFAGEPKDVNAFCEEHADLGPELKEKIESFLMAVGKFPASDVTRKETQTDYVEEGGSEKRILGDFRIIREIGRGGMGIVYQAEQLSLQRKVALKVLPSHLSFSNAAVLKFRREAEAGGKQQHPGIVAVFAVGEHQGAHYIAQELVEGNLTLADKITALQKEDSPQMGYFREIARLVLRITQALEYAHGSGVTHRDIKPSNILLTPDGRPKVTDFGLAMVEDALALSRTGDFSGTPYYMSPEQAASKRIGIDHRTDIYSLGVTLYELLTLSPPFEGNSTQEVLRKVLLKDPVDPRKENPRVPRDLAVICLKAMEKDPNNRFQSMKEFGEDLNRYLSGEVILAKPSGITTRIWKLIKRNPIISSAISIAVLAVLSLIFYILFISYPKIQEEQKKTAIALKKALLAKEQSEKHAATSNAVVEFFCCDILGSANPEKVQNRSLTVREVLDSASKSIDDKFEDKPTTKAYILGWMSSIFRRLSDFKTAEKHALDSLTLLEQEYGSTDKEYVNAQSRLAELYISMARYKDARQFVQKVLKVRKDVLGEDHQSTLYSRFMLAYTYHRLEPDKAETMYKEVLADQQRILGENHKDTIDTRYNLATLYWATKRYDKAAPIFQQMVDYKTETLGEEHPHTLLTVTNLAALYNMQKKYDKAEPLQLRTIEIQTRVLGENHSDTMTTIGNLGYLYQQTGRYEEAIPLHLKAYHYYKSNFGLGDSRTAIARTSLAQIYKKLEKHNLEEPFRREILSEYQKKYGKEHSKSIASEYTLGVCLLKQKKYQDAKNYLLDVFEKIGGNKKIKSDFCNTVLDQIILLHQGWGKREEVKKWEDLKSEINNSCP